MNIQIVPDLRERNLGVGEFADFLETVEATWLDPSFAHPGGESNLTAQGRGVDVILRLCEHHPNEHIVISTHGNLLALVLQHFDPSIDFTFWNSLSMPDVFGLEVRSNGEVGITRLWRE